MTIVVLHNSTQEIEHVQGWLNDYNFPNFLENYCEKWNLIVDDYTIFEIEGDYTLSSFKIEKYIDNSVLLDKLDMGIWISSKEITIDDVCFINGVPEFTKVVVNDRIIGYVGVDEGIELTSDTIVELKVQLILYPYLYLIP